MGTFKRIIPWLLLLAGAALITTLAWQQRTIRSEFEDHRRWDMRLSPGSYVPAFLGYSVAGDSMTIGEKRRGGRQLVFLLTSSCPYCERTLPMWKDIALRLLGADGHGDGLDVIALTTDSAPVAKSYAEANQLPFALFSIQSRRLISLYRAHVVPQTVLLDADGRVLFARHGVIDTRAAVDSVVAAALAEPAQPVRAAARQAERLANQGTRYR